MNFWATIIYLVTLHFFAKGKVGKAGFLKDFQSAIEWMHSATAHTL